MHVCRVVVAIAAAAIVIATAGDVVAVDSNIYHGRVKSSSWASCTLDSLFPKSQGKSMDPTQNRYCMAREGSETVEDVSEVIETIETMDAVVVDTRERGHSLPPQESEII